MLNMIDDSPCSARPGKDPARSAAIGSVLTRGWESANTHAASRSARRRDDSGHRRTGVRRTRSTPPGTGFSSGARKNSPRSHCDCQLRWADFRGIWRKTSSARKALISLQLWVHSWCAPRKTSSVCM
jgi:hypothetical protein